MKKEDLKKLLGTDIEETTIDNLLKTYNDGINSAVAKQKPDMDKLKGDAYELAQNDFIKGLKIDGVGNKDQFLAYKNRMGATSTELTEKNTRYKSERDDYKAKFDTLDATHKDMSTKFTGLQNESKISGSGYNMKYTNAIKAEANSRVTDDKDFSTALDDMKKDYPEWLVKGSGGGGNTGSGEHVDIDDAEVKRWKEEAGVK